jgi:hypothetical protein
MNRQWSVNVKTGFKLYFTVRLRYSSVLSCMKQKGVFISAGYNMKCFSTTVHWNKGQIAKATLCLTDYHAINTCGKGGSVLILDIRRRRIISEPVYTVFSWYEFSGGGLHPREWFVYEKSCMYQSGNIFHSKVKLSRNRPRRPIGLWDVKDSTLSRPGVSKLSGLRATRSTPVSYKGQNQNQPRANDRDAWRHLVVKSGNR